MNVRIIVLALAAIASVHAAMQPKALSGSPSEFASMELPSPTLALLDSDKAMFFVTLAAGVDGTPVFKQSFQVDSNVGFALSLFSPIASSLKYVLTNPSGQETPLTGGTPTYFPVSDSAETNAKVTGTQYEFDSPAVGMWTLTVTAPGMTHDEVLHAMKKISSSSNQGIFFVFNASPDMIASHMTHYQSVVGQQIGLNSRMFDSVAHGEMVRGVVPQALQDVVTEADMEVIFPDGHIEKVAMHDDGLHSDGEANDGAFGAQIVPSVAGSYVMQALLSGTNTAGAPFVRTTEHFITVINPSIQLAGKAAVSIHPLQNRLNIELFVDGQAASADTQYRAYAEVYGTSLTGKQVPVAWASLISSVQTASGAQFLPLQMDLHWFAAAMAVGPITLKNVWIQDVQTLVPLNEVSTMDAMAPTSVLHFINSTVEAILASGYKGQITKVMMEGQPPAHLHLKGSNSTSNGGILLALHGYCASGNPWAKSASTFTNTAFPTDLNQARSIADYSKIVVDYAAANGYTSYGILGHSLGGMVALNILNAYNTGVDAAVGNRKIQSLASPHLGNSAAGSADSMKNLFGTGCGTLYDLTVDGATLWQATLSKNAKSQLNYYTTQYDKGGLFGNGWCNMVMNSVLDNPNDGATEVSRARITEAINRGHTIGQCHIEDMKWPASFLDATRNAEINREAAR